MILRSRRILKEKHTAKPTPPPPFSLSSSSMSMEPPPLATPTLQSKYSKKRHAASSCMDDEVVEVPPPTTTRFTKSQKKKKVLINEVIEVDSDEDSIDLAGIGMKVNKAKKGKAIIHISDGCLNGLTEVVEEGQRTYILDADDQLEKTRTVIQRSRSLLINQQNGHIADTIKRYEYFKRFDTVEDYSDHYYYNKKCSSVNQPPKAWAKRIQEEWKILEKDLPETIFVRVYEERMDILRAVILGAEGTPYHDGLFFFDVFFPSNYPHTPPEVYYHAHGLRLNPNLYATGKVCLSLLNTWGGNRNEKWQPNLSTMLQVLVSIQGLILNEKPYFNEPGYANSSGTNEGERHSLSYNENTFILSLKTMSYTMRKPPKYFEDLVAGHFMTHAEDILVACRAYLDGVQVGCMIKGGLQDLEAGDKKCSDQLKKNLFDYFPFLVKDFTNLGLEGVDKFMPPPPPSAPKQNMKNKKKKKKS